MRTPLLAALLFLSALPASAKKILIIGDSHSAGPFGEIIDKELAAAGHEVAVYAVCGASARWWLGSKRDNLSICYNIHDYGGSYKYVSKAQAAHAKPAADIVKAANPDIIVFALGANSPSSTPDAAEELLALEPKSATCWWVGPPPVPDQIVARQALYNELPVRFSKVGRTCALINSMTLTCPDSPHADKSCLKESDAQSSHFYGKPAARWAKAVLKYLMP